MSSARLTCLSFACFVAASCTTATWTARSSVHPVLLGRAQRIGGGDARADRDPITSFQSTCEMFVGAAAGPSNGLGSANDTFGAASAAASTKADWDVLVAAGDDPDRVATVPSLTCDGYNLFMVFFLSSKAKCTASGQVYSRLRVAAAPSSWTRTAVPPPARTVPVTNPAAPTTFPAGAPSPVPMRPATAASSPPTAPIHEPIGTASEAGPAAARAPAPALPPQAAPQQPIAPPRHGALPAPPPPPDL